jgi:hypothetical protein
MYCILSTVLCRYNDPEVLLFILEASALDPRFKTLPYIRLDMYNNLSIALLENDEVCQITDNYKLLTELIHELNSLLSKTQK